MNINNSMISRPFALNDQVAAQIFETIPQQALVAFIIDTNGKIWPSDSVEFHKLNIREDLLKEICRKIDDGAEPVVTFENDCGFVATQFSTENSYCGYSILALPHYTTEFIMANLILFDILLNQFNLIATLIEKNNLFYEIQANRYRADSLDIITLN